MLELGQPLHAFDLGKLADSAIVVRRARASEKTFTRWTTRSGSSPATCS